MRKTAFIIFLLSIFSFCLNGEGLAARGSVPFQLHRGYLIVTKCSVGSLQDLTAIVDTGVSETVLDIDLVKQLRLETVKASATFLSREARVWEIAIPDVRLGPLHTDRLAGIAVDLSSLTAELGIRPHVLIGMDLLRQANLTIDYGTQQLEFGAALALPHRAQLLSREADSRFAVIEARVMGRSMRLQVDSGFNGLLLYSRKVPGNVELVSRESRIINPEQTLLARSFDAYDFEIGAWRPASVRLTVVDDGPPESAGFEGLIGTTFLSNRRIAFDFANGVVYWE